jgi:hypothetical protein
MVSLIIIFYTLLDWLVIAFWGSFITAVILLGVQSFGRYWEE